MTLTPFQVDLAVPDIDPWRAGNTGIPGFTSYRADAPGPHVALVALVHGNELAGAIALDRLLRAGLRPARGTLSFGFANMAAMDRFDPTHPTTSRFVDEDLNRVWDTALLDGPRRSAELRRARDIRPFLQTVDVLLDLHSMLWPSVPLILSGPTERGRALACQLCTPELVIADHGHATGKRLIDFAGFTDPDQNRTAILTEAGLHWRAETVDNTLACIAALLRITGLVDSHPALPGAVDAVPRFAEVTDTIVATTGQFHFVPDVRGGDVIPARNTLLAYDGSRELRTPHDNCLLVMPSLRPSRGHTAVRLARFV